MIQKSSFSGTAPQEEENPALEASKAQGDDTITDSLFRPKRLEEYIGQSKLKNNLHIALMAAKKREEPLEHTLLHGAPGLGKTTLAFILAQEMGANIRITSGPAIERAGDLAALLTNLKANDILFIDEIHRLRPAVEEILYSAMEDFCLDLMIGKGPSARSMRLRLPRFTLVGATTKPASLSSPLLDRFGNLLHLDFYSEEELEEILQKNAEKLKCSIQVNALKKVSHRSRRTPRIANRLLRRVRDYADVHNQGEINEESVEETFKLLGIDQHGLNRSDRRILQVLWEQFKGGPVGLSTLSAATQEEQESLEEIYEPFLMHLGFLERTPRGRLLTEKGYNYLSTNQTL